MVYAINWVCAVVSDIIMTIMMMMMMIVIPIIIILIVIVIMIMIMTIIIGMHLRVGKFWKENKCILPDWI